MFMKKVIFVIVLLFCFNVFARSTIVMDTESGRILYQNNAYEKKLIASTTKIMTFVVVPSPPVSNSVPGLSETAGRRPMA